MSTDKTLADVQPGGRVRLGDQAERARFEAWYVENAFDYEKNPIGSRECSLMWDAWQAAHATRQQAGREPAGYLYDWTHSSALGRGEEVFTAFTPDIEAARGSKGAVNIRPVYAAQPSPGGQDAARYERLFISAVEMLTKISLHLGLEPNSDGVEPMLAAIDALAARQPVGQEPVEFDYPEFHQEGMGCGLEDRGITDRYEAMRYGFDEALDQMATILASIGPLYAAPPAQAVDLAENMLSVLIEEGVLARNGRVFQKLRALIDSMAVGNGPTCKAGLHVEAMRQGGGNG